MKKLGELIVAGLLVSLVFYVLFQALKAETYDCVFGEKGSESKIEACRLLTLSKNSIHRCEGYFRLLLVEKANRTEALAACDLAVNEHSNNSFAHNIRANAYDAAGDQKTAIEEYSEAHRLSPDDPNYLENRARAWERIGDPEKVKADYAEAQKLRSKM